MMNNIVSIMKEKNIHYPDKNNIFYPDDDYPELEINHDKYVADNKIFKMFRDCFKLMSLDKENEDTPNWNPLGKFIKSGDKVLIKPNMVIHENRGNYGEDCLYTNPYIVSVIINYVWKALKNEGEIIVADAPVQECDFDILIEKSGYKDMIDYYKNKGVNVKLKDLRGLKSVRKNGVLIQEELEQKGIVVDLKNDSEFSTLLDNQLENIRITNYDPKELLKHHNKYKHEYYIAKEVLDADVIINIPKPKAHRKAGVTIGLKNFVGANVRKEYLPHHRMGDISSSGDEYLEKSLLLKYSSKYRDKQYVYMKKKKYELSYFYRVVAKIFSEFDLIFGSKDSKREGSWYGNDTIWRTTLDINKIIKYADKDGKIRKNSQRKIFNIADMIIIGEKEGPLMPSPKYGGIIVMSEDIVSFDLCIATIMGFNYKKIPTLKNCKKIEKMKISNDNDEKIISNYYKWNNKNINDIKYDNTLKIQASSGWKDHIELQ